MRWLHLFLDVAVSVELFEIGPQIVDLLRIGNSGEGHFGPCDLGLRAPDIVFERRLVPYQARILVGFGIIETCHRAGMAAVEPVKIGSDLVFRAGTDGMAWQALVK